MFGIQCCLKQIDISSCTLNTKSEFDIVQKKKNECFLNNFFFRTLTTLKKFKFKVLLITRKNVIVQYKSQRFYENFIVRKKYMKDVGG